MYGFKLNLFIVLENAMKSVHCFLFFLQVLLCRFTERFERCDFEQKDLEEKSGPRTLHYTGKNIDYGIVGQIV